MSFWNLISFNYYCVHARDIHISLYFEFIWCMIAAWINQTRMFKDIVIILQDNKMGYTCILPSCKNHSTNKKNLIVMPHLIDRLKWHKPRTEKEIEIWTEKIGLVDKSFRLTSRSFLCSNHFIHPWVAYPFDLLFIQLWYRVYSAYLLTPMRMVYHICSLTIMFELYSPAIFLNSRVAP